MFSLIKQVQLTTDFAKSGTARLAGIEMPKFEDNEQTLAELQARIRKTIDFVSSVKADSFKGAEDRDIVIPMRDTKLEFKGLAYLRNWVMPNFYFHAHRRVFDPAAQRRRDRQARFPAGKLSLIRFRLKF